MKREPAKGSIPAVMRARCVSWQEHSPCFSKNANTTTVTRPASEPFPEVSVCRSCPAIGTKRQIRCTRVRSARPDGAQPHDLQAFKSSGAMTTREAAGSHPG
jgi:hypothetical protein